MQKYYILENKKVKAATFDEWQRFLQIQGLNNSWTNVNFTHLPCETEVSTVFLMGVNFNITDRVPALFETKIFSRKIPNINNMVVRYATWKDAEEGHENMVQWAKYWVEHFCQQTLKINQPE